MLRGALFRRAIGVPFELEFVSQLDPEPAQTAR